MINKNLSGRKRRQNAPQRELGCSSWLGFFWKVGSCHPMFKGLRYKKEIEPVLHGSKDGIRLTGRNFTACDFI